MPKKKLVYLVTEGSYFCSHRLSLAVAAKRSGFDVTVATNPGKARSQIDGAGLTVIPINFRRRSINPFREFFTFLKVLGIYKRLKPEVVHHVALKPVIYGGLAAVLTGVKKPVGTLGGLGYLFTENNLETTLLRPLVKMGLKLATLKKSSRLIVQNRDDFEQLSRFIPKEKLHLVPGSGVHTDLFCPSPQNKRKNLRAVLVSRMLWTKGVGELVEASKLLKAENITLKIDLIGDTDSQNPTNIDKNTLKKWQQEGLVNWLGPQSDIHKLYQQSDIAVLPSYREGLPKSLLEAASCARPIITTDVPGCRDIVDHGKTGLLIPAKDAEALAKALKTLAQSPELREKLGANAREKVLTTYDEKIINNKMIELYTD